MPRSFKPEVVADSTGKFCGNALRFATRQEAEDYVDDLALRWTAVSQTRVIESDDEVNYEFAGGRARSLEPGDAK
jgi:hypothetical protein